MRAISADDSSDFRRRFGTQTRIAFPLKHNWNNKLWVVINIYIYIKCYYYTSTQTMENQGAISFPMFLCHPYIYIYSRNNSYMIRVNHPMHHKMKCFSHTIWEDVMTTPWAIYIYILQRASNRLDVHKAFQHKIPSAP